MPMRGRNLLAVIACAFVCACDEAPPPPATAAGPSRAATGKEAILPPQMVAAVSASRSSLLIGVHFALGATPTVGNPLPVDIAVLPHQPFTTVGVHFTSQEGLKVTSGGEMPPQAGVAGKVLTHKITLEPSREGVFMVTAAVETVSEEGTVTRLYSIPVIVSAAAPAPSAAPPTPAG